MIETPMSSPIARSRPKRQSTKLSILMVMTAVLNAKESNGE